MTYPVTVAIPVGPKRGHQEWLGEAIASVRSQSHAETQLLIIDDMANVQIEAPIWRAPWRLGVASAFNMGVALARTQLVFMLGADDTLEPDCISECVAAFQRAGLDADRTYFFVGVRYMGNEWPDQYVPCNAAMVSKTLWRLTGGFAPESASGACDAAWVSTFMVHDDVAQLRCVNGVKPLYNYRVHQGTDTAHRGSWQGVIMQTRDILTREWEPPEWGRYE